jgi:hypothetical protein
MNLTNKANNLLSQWARYEKVHYSAKTQFEKAIDIEIEKEQVTQLARELQQQLFENDKNSTKLLFLVNAFEDQLTLLQGNLTLEVLRNGQAESA